MRKLGIYLLLLLVSAIYAAPFMWMASTSIKTGREATSSRPTLLPLDSQDAAGLKERGIPADASPLAKRAGIAYRNYEKLVTDPAWDFLLYTRNTLLIAIGFVVGSVLSSSLVAYSLAKLHWRGRNVVFGIVLATMMLPFTVVMIPQYLIFKHLGFVGTNLPLWIPSFFGVPFYIFLLRQFYITIPEELLDAARIDGCSELGIWWRIVLPLSRPALATVALFAFIAAWKSFLEPLVYLAHQEQFTLSVALQFFQSRSGGTSWELLMAAALMVLAPVLILFFFFQKTLIQGIATTGLKG